MTLRSDSATSTSISDDRVVAAADDVVGRTAPKGSAAPAVAASGTGVPPCIEAFTALRDNAGIPFSAAAKAISIVSRNCSIVNGGMRRTAGLSFAGSSLVAVWKLTNAVGPTGARDRVFKPPVFTLLLV